jgi:hypothetical protein
MRFPRLRAVLSPRASRQRRDMTTKKTPSTVTELAAVTFTDAQRKEKVPCHICVKGLLLFLFVPNSNSKSF